MDGGHDRPGENIECLYIGASLRGMRARCPYRADPPEGGARGPCSPPPGGREVPQLILEGSETYQPEGLGNLLLFFSHFFLKREIPSACPLM